MHLLSRKSIAPKDLISCRQENTKRERCYLVDTSPMASQKAQQRVLEQLDVATSPATRAALLSDLGSLHLDEVYWSPSP